MNQRTSFARGGISGGGGDTGGKGGKDGDSAMTGGGGRDGESWGIQQGKLKVLQLLGQKMENWLHKLVNLF